MTQSVSMITQSWVPLLVMASSLVPGLIIFTLREEQQRLRIAFNMAGAVLKLILVAVMLAGAAQLEFHEWRMPVLPGLDLLLRTDALSLLFVTLSAVLWFFTTLYAIGYLEDSPHRSRFFGFFSLCVCATTGIALAGNLFTFFLFYELLTLATYPLVVHRGTEASLRAGRTYLAYTLAGGALLLVGVVWLHALAGPLEFTQTGALSRLAAEHHGTLAVIFVLLVGGLAVKAALVPLHGWLPVAMVAPAPVSALLHAVAVVKAGAFGIVRVVFDVYEVEFAGKLGLLGPLALFAGVTIVYGSVRALFQQDLKKRLAYSTISQVSYIVLGVALFGPLATIGGLVHLVHQGLMKVTLFFCAGNLAETLQLRNISDMNGVGRRMPLTMAAFTVGALGMVGVPPLAGFISKWHLGLGAIEAGAPWAVAVLIASSLLNAAYFLPIVYAAWFREPTAEWHTPTRGGLEASWLLLVPPLFTALAVIAVGMGASASFSPLEWARFITELEYGP